MDEGVSVDDPKRNEFVGSEPTSGTRFVRMQPDEESLGLILCWDPTGVNIEMVNGRRGQKQMFDVMLSSFLPQLLADIRKMLPK